jgi:hypothetical protein
MKRARFLPTFLAIAAAAAVAIGPARADIYTWVDAKGIINVSNLTPPEGVTVKSITPTPPRDPAREAAALEAQRQDEIRALNDRVRDLQNELEQSRRDVPGPMAYPPPFAYMPPMPMQYANPEPPATYVVNMFPQPQAPGCDYSLFDCGYGWGPGFYPVVVVANNNKPFRRHAPFFGPRSVVPPLVSPAMPRPPVRVSSVSGRSR